MPTLSYFDLVSTFGREQARKRPRNLTVQGDSPHRKGLSARNVSFWPVSCNPATMLPIPGLSHLLLKLSHFGHFQGLAVGLKAVGRVFLSTAGCGNPSPEGELSRPCEQRRDAIVLIFVVFRG
jgi:hypothetical protein